MHLCDYIPPYLSTPFMDQGLQHTIYIFISSRVKLAIDVGSGGPPRVFFCFVLI